MNFPANSLLPLPSISTLAAACYAFHNLVILLKAMRNLVLQNPFPSWIQPQAFREMAMELQFQCTLSNPLSYHSKIWVVPHWDQFHRRWLSIEQTWGDQEQGGAEQRAFAVTIILLECTVFPPISFLTIVFVVVLCL